MKMLIGVLVNIKNSIIFTFYGGRKNYVKRIIKKRNYVLNKIANINFRMYYKCYYSKTNGGVCKGICFICKKYKEKENENIYKLFRNRKRKRN